MHQHGLHRDVKGDNILVRTDGTAVLLDLGACWIRDAQTLTVGSLPPGTPIYRSPEALPPTSTGRRSVNRAPPPSSLSTSSVPPWRAAI